jgi:hypothetical protein
MDTKNIVTHNVNEGMQQNQHGGCAMMAMRRFSAEVVESELTHPVLVVGAGLKLALAKKRPE